MSDAGSSVSNDISEHMESHVEEVDVFFRVFFLQIQLHNTFNNHNSSSKRNAVFSTCPPLMVALFFARSRHS